MSIFQQNETVIGRLTVRGKQNDPLNLRLHFERLLGAENFLPEGFPSRTIVCIRHLRDPAPHSLRLDRHDLRFSDVWQKSVKREIERLFRRAFRPVRETVPPQAESIVFADRSELLACLAADWCRGVLGQNWWWHSLFPDLGEAQTVAQIWIESAEFAPNAFGILAQKNLAADFAFKLKPAETVRLLRQIIRVFGLSRLSTALFSTLVPPKKTSVPRPAEKTGKQKPSEKKDIPAHFRPHAPWVDFAPEADSARLRFEQNALVGIGLMLLRAPRVVRSDEFARRVKQFRTETEAIQRTFAGPGEKKPEPEAKTEKPPERPSPQISVPAGPSAGFSPTEPKPSAEKLSERKSPKQSKETTPVGEPPQTLSEPLAKPENDIRPAPKKTVERLKKISFEKAQTEKNLKPADREEKQRKPRQTEKTPPAVLTETVGETVGESTIETRFGGIFYLLNLGLYLRIYSDFADPLETEIELNIWDFVALLGREFLGRKIQKDPVWDLLASLAGREPEEEPGRDFDPPDEWRLPPVWLETFQTNEKWSRLKDEKRLVVRHPDGFRVIDVPLSNKPEKQLKMELRNYQKHSGDLSKADPAEPTEELSTPERWLKNLSEYTERRLRQALGVETRGQLNKRLFGKNATVAVSAANLDVTFHLADLPFEIRLSGLDRNPGWIPAAGKYVKFHYV